MNVYKGIASLNIGNGPMWQPRFHVRWVKNARGALRYIHQNPVVAGLVDAAEKYPWSSASGRWDVTDI